MLYSLELYDTNSAPTTRDGKGTLNADYATRMNQTFFDNYHKTKGDVDRSLRYKKFDVKKSLGPCADFPYGFVSDEKDVAISPCIFVKMNNIWGWKPKPIEAEDFQDNPDWPKSLETNFDNLTEAQRQQVFLDCQGESDFDKEAMVAVSYFPETKGFPIDSFPYQGNKGRYHSPLVAIKFDGSKMERFLEEMITVKCKAYYKGGPSEGEFRIRFQRKNY